MRGDSPVSAGRPWRLICPVGSGHTAVCVLSQRARYPPRRGSSAPAQRARYLSASAFCKCSKNRRAAWLSVAPRFHARSMTETTGG